MKRAVSLLPFFVAAVFPFISVQACGPFFAEDVFVRKLGADHPTAFISGKLGVLLPTYNRTDLSAAYRYLNGGSLSAEEQRAYQPAASVIDQTGREVEEVNAAQTADSTQYNGPAGPADLWLEARGHYAAQPADVHPVKQFNVVYRAGFFLAGEYENCQADAFRTAIATLENRAKAWGAHSPELADWIAGQDAVFSNCGGTGETYFPPDQKPVIHPIQPKDAPASAPLLLKQDRAYQKAAAQFYAAQFAESRAAFQAIAQDSASPWHNIAGYLVARTLIREAFLSAKNDAQQGMADFNPELMKQAQQQLDSVRAEPLHGISPHAVQALLNLVRLRTEPKVRLHEISSALAGPKPDPDYKQDLEDLDWYLNNKLDSTAIREDFDSMESPSRPTAEFETAYAGSADLSSTAPLIDWLITFQSPSQAAKKHAILEWEQHRSSVPWLLAAIAKAKSDDPQAIGLVEAASHISPPSPAWPTIAYHRIRLLIDTSRDAEARHELETDLPQVQAIGNESALNLFTGLRMRSAPTLEAALADAPRKILERSSEQQYALDECLSVMNDPKRKYDCKDSRSAVEFSGDAARVLNKSMPLDTLAEAAQSKTLPPMLRQSVAMMTWVRAVLLKYDKVADQMLPQLPEKLQQQAGAGTGFRAQMAILRNPGLRPFLDSGVQRSASYDFVESYADNWWCANWNAADTYSSPTNANSEAFLTEPMRTIAEKENTALLALGSADEYLGSQVLDYAHTHADDPAIPEALYLTLRMIRYGCYHGVSDVDNGKPDASRVPAIAREVGALMRQRYATNPWTKKAAPYVWPAKKNG